jgi:hypothetical protein
MHRSSFTGYGKKFEKKVLEELHENGVSFTFEGLKLSYSITAIYKPDIVLPNGVIIEVKTFLPYDEQRKLRAVKESNPDLDIRLLFEKPDKKLPNSKLTHGEWATKYGFIWTEGTVPKEWTE